MAGPARFRFLLEGQLALLSKRVEDSEMVQAVVATGHEAWEQVLEVLMGAGWDEHRVEAAVDTAIDWGLIHEHGRRRAHRGFDRKPC